MIPEHVETNMVFMKIPKISRIKIQEFCLNNGILINADTDTIRLVTHLDISTEKINFFVDKLKSFFS